MWKSIWALFNATDKPNTVRQFFFPFTNGNELQKGSLIRHMYTFLEVIMQNNIDSNIQHTFNFMIYTYNSLLHKLKLQ